MEVVLKISKKQKRTLNLRAAASSSSSNTSSAHSEPRKGTGAGTSFNVLTQRLPTIRSEHSSIDLRVTAESVSSDRAGGRSEMIFSYSSGASDRRGEG